MHFAYEEWSFSFRLKMFLQDIPMRFCRHFVQMSAVVRCYYVAINCCVNYIHRTFHGRSSTSIGNLNGQINNSITLPFDASAHSYSTIPDNRSE